MDRSRNAHRSRSGSVLVIILLISGAVAILGSGMFAVGYQAHAQAVRTAHEMAAGVAADAGLTQAVHTLISQYEDGTLNPDALPSQTDVDIPNFDGTFTYTITANPSGGYTITSVGSYLGAVKTVEGVVEYTGAAEEYAGFAMERLTLHSYARIDWYNYESGDDSLTVATNSTGAGTVSLANGAFINGNVMVGAGGDPDNVISASSTQYGEAYAQSANHIPSSVSVPDYLVSAVTGDPITNNATVSSSGKYSEINLGNSKRLTIQGSVELYVTGDVTLGNSAEIRVLAGSSLVLYVDGDVRGGNSSEFNIQTQDAQKLKLMCTDSCTSITLDNFAGLYGIVYAPQAQLVLNNSASMWGSVTTRTCELKNSATFFYDASLRGDSTSSSGELRLASWREY